MSQAELYVPGDIRWGLGGKMDSKWGFMPKGHGGLAPLAYFRSCSVASTDPTLTYPPVPAATNKARAKLGISIDEVGLIEIQEAFGRCKINGNR